MVLLNHAVVLGWLVGHENANYVLDNGSKVTEEMVTAMPENVNTGILEDAVVLENFKDYFDDDAWASVLDVGMDI